MNPLQEILDPKPRIEKEEKKEEHWSFLGTYLKVPGLKWYSYNTKTLETKEAEIIKTVTAGFDGKPIEHDKIQCEKNCIYFQALNFKNAFRKSAKIYKRLKK